MSWNAVGAHLFNQYLNNEAIDCFLNAIQFKEYLSEAKQNIIPNYSIIEFKKVFEMEPIVFKTYQNLIASHHLGYNTKKALYLSELVHNQINEAKNAKFGLFMSKPIISID